MKSKRLFFGFGAAVLMLITGATGVQAASNESNYEFGKEIKADTIYNDTNGFGLMDYTYPDEAEGWINNIYKDRVLVTKPGASFVKGSDGYLQLTNKVWTETESSGYGVFQYEDTTGFDVKLTPKEYKVKVVFTNPTKEAYDVSIKAEDITKVNKLNVPAGKDIEATFSSSLIDGVMDLKFFNPSDAKSYSEASEQSTFVKNIIIDEQEIKAAGEKPTVYLASDSTVQTYDDYYKPQTGWGQTLWDFFGETIEQREATGASYSQAEVYESKNTIIENRAIGGRSSKSFVVEGKLDELLDDIKKGDYLFVQFGHNDATYSRPNRYVGTDVFAEWMQKYVDGAKQRGAIPVLVTPVARYSYNDDGFKEDFKAYGDVVRKMATDQNIPLIDLSARSIELCNKFGVEGAKSLFLHTKAGEYEGAYANGVTDNTHLQYYGAYKFAQCVTQGISEMDVSKLDASTKEAITNLAKRVTFKESENVPGKINNLKLVSSGGTSATLSWDKVDGAELYYIYRQKLEDKQTIDDVDFSNAERYSVSTTANFTDKKMTKNSSYVYAVRGYNDKGEGEFSEKISVKTKSSDYKFDINWQNSPTLEGWTGVNNDVVYTKDLGYGFKEKMANGRYRKNSGNEDASDMSEDFTLSEGEFIVDLPNGTYEVTVYAGDLLAGTSTINASYTMEGKSVGNISTKLKLGSLTTMVEVEDGQLNIGIGGRQPYFNGCEITAVLLAPSGLTISEKNVEGDQISFLVGFNPVDNAVSYNIYGKSNTENSFKVIKSFTAEEYQKDELSCRSMIATVGENYQYYMTAVMQDGTETVKSNTVELDGSDTSVDPPAKPKNLKATAKKDYEKTIVWDADDKANEYIVYRSNKKDADFISIGVTSNANFSDTDRELIANRTYYYKVQAKNNGGTGEFSDVVEIKPLTGKAIPAPAETLTDRTVVAINLSGKDGGETVVSATDKDGKAYESGIYLSWRSLEVDKRNNTYDVYRNEKKIAEGIKDTNLIDVDGTASDTYKVIGSNDSEIGIKSIETKPWENKYLEMQLYKPADQTMPDGNVLNFVANDMSVGDLDGDGQLELIVKWVAGGQDNSKGGYTGTTILDGYDIDFTTGETDLLWRIDLGVNIRSGAHYTQFQVWDYDGDGKAEIAVKTADGSTTYQSMDHTDQDLKETGYVGACNADALPTNVISKNHDYRNSAGYVLDGPEYFTIFNGEDGTIVGTADYKPARGNVKDWGDSYGNRVDRFLAGTAYLDGKAAYAVMGRGYYTRTAITAYYLADTDNDGIGDSIREYWAFDSDVAGKEYEGQGNHNLSIADVDNDGKDEIIYGSIAFDDDGSVLYNTGLGHGDAMHLGDLIPEREGLELMTVKEENGAKYHVLVSDAATGEVLMGYATGRDTGRGAVADIDPTSPGAEFWSIVGDKYNPEDGEPAWNSTIGKVYATTSTLDNLVQLSETNPAANGLMYWDGDLLREIQDHEFNEKGGYVPISSSILKWDYENEEQVPLFDSSEVYTNNGTKGNPGISGDLLGDWREEVILRSATDDSKIRIYSTTIQTDYVIPSLLENRMYREGLAWQNTAYNQPPHTDYLLSEGVLTSKVTAEPEGNNVNLTFTEASDGKYGHDVEGYQVWRWEKDSKDKEVVAQIKNDDLKSVDGKFVYTDKTAESSKEYHYAVSAVVNDRSSYLSKSVGVKTDQQIDADSISLSATALKTMKQGKTLQVNATLTPSNATSIVTWESSKPEVATIDDSGKIKAIKTGIVVIKAKTSNGKTAQFTLRVTN